MSHDYDWKAKHERKREFWPEGSLERTLALSGCKSLSEAIQKAKTSPQSVSPPEVIVEPIRPRPTPEYVAMNEAIKEIEAMNFDADLLDEATRKHLANIPINSIDGVKFWKESWLNEIKKIMEQQNGPNHDHRGT